MKIFITGGAGFIGSTMVTRLIANPENEIVVFDNFLSGKMELIEKHISNKRFKLIKGDLLDLPFLIESMKGSEFVYHFAANADISKAMEEPDIDLKLTVVATFNVMESMRINGIKKIVYSSGSGVYGDVGDIETPEDFGPLLPSSMYGASKLGAEGIISAFCSMFDMQSWIFRFANVIGENQTHGVGFDFINKLSQDPTKLSILGDGSQSKSYIHIDDVLNAILFVLEKTNEKVNIFNVATGDYITVIEIAHMVIEEMGLKNVQVVLGKEKRGWKGDVPVVRFDLNKIKKLGWVCSLSTKEALRKSVRQMLSKKTLVG